MSSFVLLAGKSGRATTENGLIAKGTIATKSFGGS